MADPIVIYTDGGASGNPGPGGYGVVMRYKNHQKEISEGFQLTTNNRMELLAVIIALEQLKTHNMPVRIYTDSKYVADAVEKGWLANWQRKQFKKVKNPDLWQRFLRIYTKLTDIKFNWVKGHAGNELNERADRLAVEAYKLPGLKEDTGYVQQNGTLLDG
ncbi:MAG: ribonuclease HI [Salinivirgaceae bacterium]|jgi:ribonuclease HI|nr:ribonuclease HI [Salinivirgaceae bacterium]